MHVTQISGREAAKILKVSHQTVFNWIKAGKLEPANYSTTGPLFDPEYIRSYAETLERERQAEQPVAS